MAFKDITKVLYNGSIKLDYKDKAHRYYARTRANWDLPADDPKAWSKIIYPKGTTTLIGDTLEKNGLLTWPMGLALRYLFGFYDFTNENGERLTGFSKGVGVLRGAKNFTDEELLAELVNASKEHTRRKKKGADIGSVVHDAIEHYLKGEEYDIAENYMWGIKDAWPMPEGDQKDEFEAERNLALEAFDDDVASANMAFDRFKEWWTGLGEEAVIYGLEDLLYSKTYNVCGTYDGDIGVPKSKHPMGEKFDKDIVRVTADWKTSNASKSKAAAMPQGVNYQYFVQSAIYEMIRREMGMEPADDLLIVSARKDGGFDTVYASELDLTVEECINWAEATIVCYHMMDKTKKGLLSNAEEEK